MPQAADRTFLDRFTEIVQREVSLAPYTYLKIGGPAELFVQPRSVEELQQFLKACQAHELPVRVLGAGCKLLVNDNGVRGAVLRLCEPAFTQIQVEQNRARAGAGAQLSALISEAARHGLAGIETLVGIPGTVGGALRCNAGDRSGEVGQYIRSVEVLDEQGDVQVREREDLRFGYHWSNLDDPIVLRAEFQFELDLPEAIVKRLRKAWIQRKASQPLSFLAAARMFKNPRGLSASSLITQAALVGTRVGGAEVNDRDANFVVARQGATARDVLRLLDLIRSRVREQSGIDLELELAIW